MRTIKFRGYNRKNKKWLYGYYFVNRGKHYITDDLLYPTGIMTWEDFLVDPESVGQLVGQYNGQNIFEGDIVKVTEIDGWKSTYTGKVVYDKINCRFVVEVTEPYPKMIPITGEKQTEQIGMGASCEFYYRYEVIGNEYEERLKDKR